MPKQEADIQDTEALQCGEGAERQIETESLGNNSW